MRRKFVYDKSEDTLLTTKGMITSVARRMQTLEEESVEWDILHYKLRYLKHHQSDGHAYVSKSELALLDKRLHNPAQRSYMLARVNIRLLENMHDRVSIGDHTEHIEEHRLLIARQIARANDEMMMTLSIAG